MHTARHCPYLRQQSGPRYLQTRGSCGRFLFRGFLAFRALASCATRYGFCGLGSGLPSALIGAPGQVGTLVGVLAALHLGHEVTQHARDAGAAPCCLDTCPFQHAVFHGNGDVFHASQSTRISCCTGFVSSLHATALLFLGQRQSCTI